MGKHQDMINELRERRTEKALLALLDYGKQTAGEVAERICLNSGQEVSSNLRNLEIKGYVTSKGTGRAPYVRQYWLTAQGVKKARKALTDGIPVHQP